MKNLVPPVLASHAFNRRDFVRVAIDIQSNQIGTGESLLRKPAFLGARTERWRYVTAHSLYPLLRLGLKTNFIDEGSFKARVLANDEKFPEPDFDLRSVEVPVSV